MKSVGETYEPGKVYAMTIDGRTAEYLVMAHGTKGMVVSPDNGKTMILVNDNVDVQVKSGKDKGEMEIDLKSMTDEELNELGTSIYREQKSREIPLNIEIGQVVEWKEGFPEKVERGFSADPRQNAEHVYVVRFSPNRRGLYMDFINPKTTGMRIVEGEMIDLAAIESE